MTENDSSFKSTLLVVAVAAALVVSLWFFLYRQAPKVIPAPAPIVKLEAVSPSAKQYIWLKSNEGLVFEWNGQSDNGSTLQIAQDAKFTKVFKQLEHVKSPFTVQDLKRDSNYFWRVVDLQAGVQTSTETREFFVGEKAAPVLLAPASGTKTPLRRALLAWHPKAHVDSYRLQISLRPSFNDDNVVRDLVVGGGDRYQASELPPGRYYWRVSVRDRKPLRGLWSEGREIIITHDRATASYEDSPWR